MSKANTDRGKATEQLAVSYLRTAGFPQAERSVRTGYRVRGGRELPDAGDIDGTPGIVWQVKSLRPATRAEASVGGWLVETEQQRQAAGAVVAVLVVRRELHQPGRWWAFVPLTDLFGLADGFSGALIAPDIGRQLTPARVELSVVCAMLRGWGFGTPLDDEDRPTATPGGVPL